MSRYRIEFISTASADRARDLLESRGFCQCEECNEWLFMDDESYTIDCNEEATYCSRDCAEAAGYASCDSCDEWFDEDHIDGDRQCPGCREPESQIGNYHGATRRVADSSPEQPFLIGVEIEKEDPDLRDSLECNEVPLPSGWIAENDCSLDPDYGVELVTPAYNLSDWERMLGDFRSMRRWIDGAGSDACGGHITVSRHGVDAIELAEGRLLNCFPVLCSIYSDRLLNWDYCSGHHCKELSPGGPRSRPFNVKHAGMIEFRIFPHVFSAFALSCRVHALRWFLTNDVTWRTALHSLQDGELCDWFRADHDWQNLQRAKSGNVEMSWDQIVSNAIDFKAFFEGKEASRTIRRFVS